MIHILLSLHLACTRKAVADKCPLPAGAKVHHHITEVVTNLASFERAPLAKKRFLADIPEADISAGPPSLVESSTFSSDSAQDLVAAGAHAPYGGKSGNTSCSHRLVIYPRHEVEEEPHGCPLCPANLCKVQTPSIANVRLLHDCQKETWKAFKHVISQFIYQND
jgi:hypothetical protein